MLGSRAFVLAVIWTVAVAFSVPASTIPSAAYPEWAHSHMVWLRSGATQAESLQLVRDYFAHNISVGGTDIDSQWATGDNSFVWNTRTFPNATAMVQQLHAWGVRVVLWATSMVDTDSPNFAEAKAKGYLVSGGKTVKWWHGHGAFLDYTYPAAVAWWNAQLDNVLVGTGVDGFKNDGTDPFILELDAQGGAKGHDGQPIHYRDYANLYYGGFFNHSRTRNPNSLCWSRPVDSFNNDLYWRFAPRYVSFSGWVGDQDPTFAGLRDAMNNMLHSAWANYVSFGSDTGGYRGSPMPQGRTRETLLRWAQLNSLMGLFENGGDNEVIDAPVASHSGGLKLTSPLQHRPWMFAPADTTTAIYRYFVNLHMSLQTYLLTSGTAAYENGGSLIMPVARKPLLPFDQPSTYAYWLGPSVFVDPVLDPNVTSHRVHFPAGANFVDWLNTSRVYRGGTSATIAAPLDGSSMSYPVFHKAGALLVRNIIDASAPSVIRPLEPPAGEPLEVLLPWPVVGQRGHAAIRRWRQPSQEVSYVYHNATTLELRATAHPRALRFVLAGVVPPRACMRAGGAKVMCAMRGAELHIVNIACHASGAQVFVHFA